MIEVVLVSNAFNYIHICSAMFGKEQNKGIVDNININSIVLYVCIYIYGI